MFGVLLFSYPVNVFKGTVFPESFDDVSTLLLLTSVNIGV